MDNYIHRAENIYIFLYFFGFHLNKIQPSPTDLDQEEGDAVRLE